MLSTLYARLALVLLVLFFGLGVGFLLITRFVSTTYQQEVSQKVNRDLAAHIVAEHRLIGNDGVNRPALQEVFHYMMVVNPAIEVYLLDPKGLILADAAPPGRVKRRDVSLAPVGALLNPNARMPVLGDDPRNPEGRKVFSVAPVEEAGRLRGYVYVILSGETQESTAKLLRGSYILQLGAWAIVACLLFALLAGLLLFGLLTRRLRHMASAVAAFETSNFAAPLAFLPNPAGRDEIDRLGSIVHAMSARIIDQLRKLAQTDTMRRELVANVSHDLRTPLSAMQGYLETLLIKGDSLTVEEQRRYLETAKRHGDRLGVLVEHMFELAKLDSRETLPQCEPHSLGEIMQDVAQKYELYARERGVRIETELQHDAPFVNADIAMIERVFENLIENALRYSQEGGVVRLALGTDRRRVQVVVSDTGSGIPPERLPYIFDRFYHSEDTPPEKSRSAGLGLAIVKRILELHGSAISVVSNPAAGTTFSFDLPATR
ncbi:MAG: sensor histidine kinase [Chromatiales bacterium]